MDAVLWIGLGLIAGGVVSLIFDDDFIATLRNIFFGFTGSVIGGGIMTNWDAGRLSTVEFYLYSIIFTLMLSLCFITLARVDKKIFTESKKLSEVDEVDNKVPVSSQTIT